MPTNEADVVARWRAEAQRMLGGADPDVIDEVAHHLADRWIHLIDAGSDAASADQTVWSDLERWRAVPRRRLMPKGAAIWSGVGGELKRAPRAFRTHPISSVGAAVLSAIAITAIVATFVIVYGVLARPLPYPDAERLAVIWQIERSTQSQISYPDLADVSAPSVFAAVSAMSGGRGSLRVGDTIHRINAISFEPSGFAMLGATPYLGRLVAAADADTSNVMISHKLWSTVLNSDAAIIGRVLWLSGRDVTVVGVLPPGFDFELPVPPFKREKNDVWMLLDRKSPLLSRRDCSCYESLVRLAPGFSTRDAQAAVDAIAGRLAREHASTNASRAFRVAPLRDDVVASVRAPLAWLSVAAAVTLLVALANLVVLGLSRWSERQVEFTIRGAIGATSFRLRRQIFCESLLIAVCGGVCGVAVAYQLVDALRASEAAKLPRVDAVQFDAPAWVVTVLLIVLTTLVMTWQPLRLRPSALQSGQRLTDRHVRRSRRILVTAEIALALVLVTGSALMTLSIIRLLDVDPGFEPRGAATARVSAYAARYPAATDVTRFFDAILDDLRATPDIAAAGAASSLPLSGQMTGTAVVAQGHEARPGSATTAGWQVMTPEYTQAVGLRLKAGRDFTPGDRARQGHVTIITESLARELFPGQDPIGRSIGVGGGEARGDWHEIVGIVGDVRHQALDTEPEPRVFDLLGQHWERTLYLAARSRSGTASAAASAVRRVALSRDPEVPVFEAATLEALVDRSAAPRRLASRFALQLAGVAVLLTVIGVYAVAAAGVADQSHEIGIRAALGASQRDLVALVAREALWSAAWGGGAGLLASFAVAALLQAQLFGVAASDRYWLVPGTLGIVVIVLMMAVVPVARRAATIDPLKAMRIDS
jgi:predicted permease